MSHHTNSSSYAAVFGRNPALSAAELFALSQKHGFSIKPLNTFAIELIGFDLALAGQLGGTTKIIELEPAPAESAEEAVMALAGRADSARKIRFGLSSYGSVSAAPLNKLMKKMLTKRGVSSGFILAQGNELSAVQVHHNKLIAKGADWCLFETVDGYRYGRTVWVYDFVGFNHRDYDKPAADAKRGMLPPQLARTMVNLAGTKQAPASLYDPFCGSGVVLMEAMLTQQGVKMLYGSDLSVAAVRDTVKNLRWLKKDVPDCAEFRVDPADATEALPFSNVGAIVTEGYLGEPIRDSMTEADLEGQAKEVEVLYQKFLTQAAHVLSAGQRLVVTVPAWRRRSGLRRLSFVDRASEFGYTKVRPLSDDLRVSGLTDRDTIDVARPKARVIHELLILEKTDGTY